jgi:hypothetical protein
MDDKGWHDGCGQGWCGCGCGEYNYRGVGGSNKGNKGNKGGGWIFALIIIALVVGAINELLGFIVMGIAIILLIFN